MKLLKTKYLTPICFLIFFTPFLRMCSVSEVETVEKNIKDTAKFPQHDIAKKDVNLNAYQLGFGIFNKEFLFKMSMDKDFFPMFCYSLILILSLLMVVFSWLRKYLFVRNMAIINIILLIISTLLFIKPGVISRFGDVKYGLYVFLFYSVFIIFTAWKEHRKLNEL